MKAGVTGTSEQASKDISNITQEMLKREIWQASIIAKAKEVSPMPAQTKIKLELYWDKPKKR